MPATRLRTREEFDSATGKGSSLVLFYSDWCPFCRSFMPAFENAAGESLLKVSTDDLPELEELFGIEVVPTVLCFKSGKLHARLDGQLGRGITPPQLEGFAAGCAGGGKK